ncbi:MAG: hypothetical protein ACRDX8_11620 [Acidimicrobiales bacterium]
MLRCALDVHPTSIRLVLFGFWEGDVPAHLQTRLLWSRNSARVLDVLETWSHWYALDHDSDRVVVGCRADPWPARLARRLRQAGYTLQWIEDDQPLKEGVAYLDSLQQSPLFLRATLMAHWPSACALNKLDGTVLEVQYRLLRARLMELEHRLYAEARLPCPGHLLPLCPDCEFRAFLDRREPDWPDELDDEPVVADAHPAIPLSLELE